MRKRTRAVALNILFAVYFVSAVEPSGFAQDLNPSAAPSSPSGLPLLQTVKSCMNGEAGAECLDQLFGAALGTHSTMELLQLIERFEAEDAELRRVTRPATPAVTMVLWSAF